MYMNMVYPDNFAFRQANLVTASIDITTATLQPTSSAWRSPAQRFHIIIDQIAHKYDPI
jgi:hypothetical protein